MADVHQVLARINMKKRNNPEDDAKDFALKPSLLKKSKLETSTLGNSQSQNSSLFSIAQMINKMPSYCLGDPMIRNAIMVRATAAFLSTSSKQENPQPKIPNTVAETASTYQIPDYKPLDDDDSDVTEVEEFTDDEMLKQSDSIKERGESIIEVKEDEEDDPTLERSIIETKIENSTELNKLEIGGSYIRPCSIMVHEVRKHFSRSPKHSEEKFEYYLGELKKYKEINGDCNVPHTQGKLGVWVKRNREAKKQGKLTAAQEKKLEELGFKWNVRIRVPFEERLEQLLKFKEIHQHTRVSLNSGPLGDWVSNMRIRRKQGMLREEYVKKLEEIGFCWDASEFSGNPKRKVAM